MKTVILVSIVVLCLAALAFLTYAPLTGHTGTTKDEGNAAKGGAATTIGPELVFCSDPWMPYVGTTGEKREGYVVDLLREVYRPLGYNVRLVNKPWTRCIEEVRAGKMNGLTQSDRREAPDFIFSSEPIGSTRPTFFARAGSDWKFEGVESLWKIRLGAIQTYTYERAVDEYIRLNADSGRVLLVHGNDALTRLATALQAGRIDAFVENRVVGLYLLREMGGAPDAYRLAGEAPGLLMYLPLSPILPELPALAQFFDKRIRELRTSGRLASILSEYGTEDWIEPGQTLGERKPQ